MTRIQFIIYWIAAFFLSISEDTWHTAWPMVMQYLKRSYHEKNARKECTGTRATDLCSTYLLPSSFSLSHNFRFSWLHRLSLFSNASQLDNEAAEPLARTRYAREYLLLGRLAACHVWREGRDARTVRLSTTALDAKPSDTPRCLSSSAVLRFWTLTTRMHRVSQAVSRQWLPPFGTTMQDLRCQPDGRRSLSWCADAEPVWKVR